MKKKLLVGIGLTLVVSLAGAALAVDAQDNVPENTINKRFEPDDRPWKETEAKEVLDRVYAEWEKGKQKLTQKQLLANENEWKLYAGFDIGKDYTDQLSKVEAQSFHISLCEAKKAYKPGDSAYGIFINNKNSEAKVIWQRADGKLHVADLKKDDQKTSLSSSNDSPKWNLADAVDLD
ncbi:hypothetical protein AV654_33275 [Paenibacillus elgii]|uniref:Uncharacterized protein n=1 Tax=Paenibacillus elgii TaxID=189691 RepID=A0A163U095_9BACL|nr:hypothetical protein [Paenibacillus elgii]KZE72640.1 hypothetical protein AV654_33275 [Paenibacillus elgii]